MPIASTDHGRHLLSRAYAHRDRAELDLYEIQARRRAVVQCLNETFGEDLGLRNRGLAGDWALAATLHRSLGDISVAWIRQTRRLHRLNRLILRLSAELEYLSRQRVP